MIPSPEEFCSNARFYLTHLAAGVANRLELTAIQTQNATGVPTSLTWPILRAALRKEFGKPLAGHMLITAMFQISQKPGESVDALTARFEVLLFELTRQELDSRDLVVALYMHSLAPSIRDRVEESVNGKADYFDQVSISATESRAALAHVRTLAKAREAFLASQKPQSSHIQRTTPVQSNHSNSHPSNQHKANDQPRRFERVPDELFKDRMNSGLCGKCGASGHPPHSCPNKRSVTASTAPAKRSNNRFNVMGAVAETETQHDSQHSQSSSASAASPKNM